jgi:hypothetical protein
MRLRAAAAAGADDAKYLADGRPVAGLGCVTAVIRLKTHPARLTIAAVMEMELLGTHMCNRLQVYHVHANISDVTTDSDSHSCSSLTSLS